MKKFQRILAICLVVILCAASLTACGGSTSGTGNSGAASSEQNASAVSGTSSSNQIKPVTLKVFISDSGYQPKNYGQDPQSKAIIEKTGVTLDISIPAGDPDEKAQMMLVSGDLPDIMWLRNGTTYEKYVAGNVLQPIDELIKKYNYPNIFGNYIPDAVANYYKRSDGHIYGVPTWTSDDGFGAVGAEVNVRNDIYEKLGKPDIKTIDDFYNYLVNIKKLNLKQDGQDVVPLGIHYGQGIEVIDWISKYSNFWGSKNYNLMSLDEKNQKINFMFRDKNVLSALKFLNKVYNEGLMNSDVLTIDSNKRNEAFSSGKYAVWLTDFWNLWTANSVLSQKDPKVYYKGIPTPEGTPGTKANFAGYNRIGDRLVVVPKNCKDTEAAMRFINFVLSDEGQMLDFWGIENETYVMKNGKPEFKEGVYEGKLADWWGYGAKTGIRYWDFIPTQKFNYERTVESPDRQADRKIAQASGFDAAPMISIYVDSTSEAGIAVSNIQGALPNELTKIIIEKDSSKVDEMYNSLVSAMDKLGAAKAEEAWTKAYQEKLKLMGN